jgi:hypothetical protein
MPGGVEFDEEISANNFRSRSEVGGVYAPGIPGWLIKKGIVKNVRQANVILVMIMLIMFAASGFVLISYTPLRTYFIKPATPPLPVQQINAQKP